ncbi:cytochrome c-type biogenesis protein [Legionella clemsonensis]|uniref:Cytochrome c-type biogenesis protein n=1 Tax=Legionella clemsonensis TaxID=1867846 RepID=A0A222P394_9GAMM|nr:cytochrome c-type biogenesis protein [Legionella clemsonensis]ASQ46316.1 Cytochrome c-type biogenesis protein CcmH precursor [Legionella clemsonensis]
MRNSNVFLFLIFILFGTVSSANNTLYPLENTKQEAQFSHLLKELRCLVCQNQDLADSNASLAKDLRDQVYNLVREGKADSEIIDYLTARYGDFILFKPPVKPLTAFLWFGPVIFLLAGFIIFWRTCLKRSSNE